jgi:cell wall-associated NlpC family hydrolase
MMGGYMKFEHLRLTALLLVGSILFTMIPASSKADTGAEVTGYITEVENLFSAGAHSAINETVVMLDDNDMLASDITDNDAPEVSKPGGALEDAIEPSEYANIAIAQVEIYLNIREAADADAELVGKLYHNSAATVLETLDGWYKITSGNVTGYVSSYYVVVGDEALCKSVSKRMGTVDAEALKVRKDPSLEADVYTLWTDGKEITILDETIPGWYKATDGNYTGYVSSDYVTVETRYTYAESREEEAKRLAAEEAARKAEAERKAKEEAKKKAEAQAKPNKTYNPPKGSNGQAVVDYAVQFVGNPYVWGGESLTKGADCSGFVKAVYAQFGISLPHSSYSLRYEGYAISEKDLQPGDIICYNGHVGIYIGDGKMVHASSEKTGIIISPYNYRKPIAFRRIL